MLSLSLLQKNAEKSDIYDSHKGAVEPPTWERGWSLHCGRYWLMEQRIGDALGRGQCSLGRRGLGESGRR